MRLPISFAAAFLSLALLLAPSARAGILFSENFDPGAYPWNTTSIGSGASWFYDHYSCGMLTNLTGGAGNAACASSNMMPGAFDASLISPSLDLSGAAGVVLSYRANFQHFYGDTLDLDVSTDGGFTWLTVLRWQEDQDGLPETPGELVTLSLSAYVSPQTRLRWRYYDPSPDASAWWVQLDDIVISSLQGPSEVPEPASLWMAAAGFCFLLFRASRR